MNTRTVISDSKQCRLMSIEMLMEYTSLGKGKAAELGKEAGARVYVGKRILFDRHKIDPYIDGLVD